MKRKLKKATVVLLMIAICVFSIDFAVLAKENAEQVEEVFNQYISAVVERKMNQVEVLWSHKKDVSMTHRFQRVETLNEAFEWKGVQNVFEGIFFPEENRLMVRNVVIAVKGDRASVTFDYSVTLPKWGQRAARSSLLFREENGQWLIYNHAWYLQDAQPVSPDEEAALTQMLSTIKEAYNKGDVLAMEAISDANHIYVSVTSKTFEGWRASRDALAVDLKQGNFKLDDVTLLITVDQKTAIAFAKEAEKVIASFRFEKIGGLEWKMTKTDLSGKRILFAVEPLKKHITSWGQVKQFSLQ
jgi:hypothetical protein